MSRALPIAAASAILLAGTGLAVLTRESAAQPTESAAKTVAALTETVPAPALPAPVPAQPVPKPQPWDSALDDLAIWTETGYSNRDPRFETTVSVLRHHLSAGLERWQKSDKRGYGNTALVKVILQAVTAEDRDLVIASMESAPFLITAVTEQGWTSAARPTLLRGLAANQIRSSWEADAWTEALAGIATADDLPVLIQAMARMRDGGRQAKLIQGLTACPGFDKHAALHAIWGARFATDYQDQQLGLAVLAAQAGIRDAIVACGQAQDATRIPEKLKRQIAAWLASQPAAQVAATGHGLRPGAWFRDQEKRLVFTGGVWETRPIPVEPPSPPQMAPQVPGQPDRPIPPPPPGLSADADGPAVVAWLDARAAEVKPLKNLKGTEPLRADLEALPPARLGDVLAVVDRYNANWAMRGLLQSALPNMVRYEHRDLVLAQMEAHPELIGGLLTHGWGPAAAPTLRRMLAEAKLANHFELTLGTVQVLASLADPEDADLLTRIFRRTLLPYWQARQAKALERFPGLDLKPLVREAWENAGKRPWQNLQDALAVPAAKIGIAEALPIAMAQASGEKTGWNGLEERQSAREFVAATFHLPAEEAVIAEWWAEAKPKVVWNQASQSWSGPPARPESKSINF